MSEWKKVKLGDAITFKNGKKRPSSFGSFPIYGGNGILNYCAEFNYSQNLIIGRVGAYCGCVFLSKEKCWVSDNAICGLPKELTDLNFAYYLLKTLNLNHRSIGSGQPLLTQEILNNIEVSISDLETQKKIAAILGALDDKIELNNKINKNLEQQAQTLFKEYFLDNPNPNWKHGKLSDFITVKYGKDHKKLADGKIPVYGSGGIMRYVEKALYDRESVLIPRKGTLNNVMYVNEPFWSVDTMFYTEMKKEHIAKFVFFFVKSLDLESMNAGSAVPSMTTEILNKLEIVVPDDKSLEKYDTIVSSLFNQIDENSQENHALSQLRDTLLAKLMGGEVEVK